jgi:hypothetical protein
MPKRPERGGKARGEVVEQRIHRRSAPLAKGVVVVLVVESPAPELLMRRRPRPAPSLVEAQATERQAPMHK